VTLVEVQQRSAVFDSAAGRTELKLPAGAPIDQVRGRADEDRDRPPAAASMLHPQPAAAAPHFESGPGPARTSLTPASSDGPTGATLERLRRTIEKRRAERAAASHEGEH
jgi:general secretion pathway protein N